jgi:Flp pilus assembly protein TadG
MAKLSNRRRQRRGAYVVEFAVVASVFFLFLFGILEYARFVMTLEILQNAAREGARYAVVHTHDKTTADVQNEVDQRLGGMGVQLKNYNKTTSIEVYMADQTTGSPVDTNGSPVSPWTKAPFTDAKFGQPIAVKISGTYTPVLPTFLMMGNSINIQTRYLMQSEAN